MVRMFNPPDLITTYRRAKIQEENAQLSKRGFQQVGSTILNQNYNSTAVTKATVLVQRLTLAQMQE